MPLSASSEKKKSISVPSGVMRGGASYVASSPDPASMSKTKLSDMLMAEVVAVVVTCLQVFVSVVVVVSVKCF